MNRRLPISLCLLATLLLASPLLVAQSSLHPLQGTWIVTCTPDNDNTSGREYQDTWTFRIDDTFTSEQMKKKGFADGHVDEDARRFGPSKWNTTIKSEKEGSIKYQGTADGNNIIGTFTWTKANGDTAGYSFRGEPKR